MSRLVDAGQVERVADYRGQTSHSIVSLTSGQRTFASELLDALDRLQNGDPQAIVADVRAGRAILSDPVRVRALMRRGFASNKLLNNPVSGHSKKQLVLDALAMGPATSEVLVRDLTPKLTKALVGQTLSGLVRAGLVEGRSQPRSPQKLWALLS